MSHHRGMEAALKHEVQPSSGGLLQPEEKPYPYDCNELPKAT
ncbi:hypothetical protein QTH97_30840 [Variovorax sp. J22R24]|nr:hypothetical protein [Variovorax sp. J22R24]MDM0109360.1 hypothetical protein [Variovorax sp. J22R24]